MPEAYSRTLNQKMGLLLLLRTTPAPPFERTGIDFTGPFHIQQGHVRKPTRVKCYTCLFICLTTKAIHIEFCAYLSTEEFMAALHHFTARRGTPLHLFSDNGTNFLGTCNELMEIQNLIASSSTVNTISYEAIRTSLQWHFSPPRAPHHGGLREAGVKSMKTLLRKLMSPYLLTFHELYTILTVAEAILSSRPLVPINSTDVEHTLTLSPGHFLIDRPLIAPPIHEEDTVVQVSLLKKWNLVQRLKQEFWSSWKTRYLQSMTARSKWKRPTHNYKVGDIILLKDELLFNHNWPLARVTKIYLGDDGLTRTVDLFCHGKIFRRATNRLILIVEDQPFPPSMFRSDQTAHA